jgi:MFS transporter, DHA1 family, tetracycline resistance protein
METAAPAPDAAYAQKRTTHLLVFFTILIDLIGFGILIPNIQPLLRHLLAEAPPQLQAWHFLLVSSIMCVYSLMQFFFSPILGRISDRVGRRPVIIFSMLGSMAGYLLIAYASQASLPATVSIGLLFTARIVTGIFGACYSTAQACLTDITAPEKRAGVMGMIGAAFGLGFMIGPLVGGLVSASFGLATPFLVAAALSLFNALWCWKSLPETLAVEKRGLNSHRKSLWQTLGHLKGTSFGKIALTNFLVIAAFSMMTTSFVVWAEDVLGLKGKGGGGSRQVGMIFFFIGFIGVLIQGGLIRRIAPGREKKLALIGIGIMAAMLAWLPNTGLWATLMVCLGFLATGNSLTTPTLNSLGSRCADATAQGEALGALSGFGSLGRAVGPVGAGLLMHYLPAGQHYAGTFSFAAGLMGVAIIAASTIQQPAAK